MAPVPKMLLDTENLQAIVERIAAGISERHHDGVVIASVLRGSVPFVADLVRAMTIHPVIDFLAIASYSPGTGRVRLMKDLDIDIAGKEVVVVEDIVDTGLTAAFLKSELERRRPASLSFATLLDRPARRLVPVELDWIGATISDDFVVGYGLDFEGRYRNVRSVAAADRSELLRDPDVYVSALYGTPSEG